MKIVPILAAAALASVALTGCITAPTGGSRYAYYDGTYGAYHGGFWGREGDSHYYYTDAAQRAFVRDDAGHFVMWPQHGYMEVRSGERVRNYERKLAAQPAQQATLAAPQQ